MKPSRLAIVTSRFWPVSGISQLMAGDLAEGFQSLGHEVKVLTTRWDSRWSKDFVFRGVPVTRIPTASSGPWGNFRSQRMLLKQLTLGEFDSAILFGIQESFEPLVRAAERSSTKIILRLDDSVSPQELWAKNLNRKTIAALESIHAITCTSEVFRDRLIAAGVTAKPIHVIPDGTPSPPESQTDRSSNFQSACRMALSDAHPVLAIDPNQTLVLTGAPLNGDAGIFDLVRAWKQIALKHPKAKLWILGDGTQGKKVWAQITSANLVYTAIMPGFFDCLDEVFAAADFCIHPCRDEIGQSFLTRAMASGLCPISTDDLGGIIRDGVNGKIIPKQDPKSIVATIDQLIGARTLQNELGYAAKISVTSQRTIESTIQAYLDLIQQPSLESIQ